jgi:hypothetical protein
MSKTKKPADVLVFFPSPTGRYMGHFFHFVDDAPTAEAKSRTKRTGEKTEKAIYRTNKEKLFVSHIDDIVKKQKQRNGKTLEDIACGVLSSELLDQLEAAHLDINETITWAKAHSVEAINALPKGSRKSASKVDADIKMLVNTLAQLAPGLSPVELKAKLVNLVGNEEKLDMAVNILVEKMKAFEGGERDKKGFIRLKRRTGSK